MTRVSQAITNTRRRKIHVPKDQAVYEVLAGDFNRMFGRGWPVLQLNPTTPGCRGGREFRQLGPGADAFEQARQMIQRRHPDRDVLVEEVDSVR